MGLDVVWEETADGGGDVETFALTTTPGSMRSEVEDGADVDVGLQDRGMDWVWHRGVFPLPKLSRTQEP